jgi:hypothetical protein
MGNRMRYHMGHNVHPTMLQWILKQSQTIKRLVQFYEIQLVTNRRASNITSSYLFFFPSTISDNP